MKKPDKKFEPVVQIPPLEDDIHLMGGNSLFINRDNTEVVLHRNFNEFDHLHITLGKKAMLIFNISATPLAEYLVNRGYRMVVNQYPTLNTQRIWLDYTMSLIDKEQEGLGHELDE